MFSISPLKELDVPRCRLSWFSRASAASRQSIEPIDLPVGPTRRAGRRTSIRPPRHRSSPFRPPKAEQARRIFRAERCKHGSFGHSIFLPCPSVSVECDRTATDNRSRCTAAGGSGRAHPLRCLAVLFPYRLLHAVRFHTLLLYVTRLLHALGAGRACRLAQLRLPLQAMS